MKQLQRQIMTVQGRVQGVGFRPFVYRLATALGLNGFVRNTSAGVQIEIEGERSALDTFLRNLKTMLPPEARISTLQNSAIPAKGTLGFTIELSAQSRPEVFIAPDLATCERCLQELFDPNNRRYRYPFVTCSDCGPRYTLAKCLPFDRANTSMAPFRLCTLCQAEYESPSDRRFHAQTISCAHCGPALTFKSGRNSIEDQADALSAAIALLQSGGILALKGVGGFHLLCRADADDSIGRIRKTKHRPSKPFATMFENIETLRECCDISEPEENLLRSSAAPIVLLKKKPAQDNPISPQIAPNLPRLGAMLPYTPLHHLLLHELKHPLVVTSGNRGDEPLCVGNDEAMEQLSELADGFLLHDREIFHRIDDSVVQAVGEYSILLRRGRGLAPSFLHAPDVTAGLLAVGAHQKNSIALSLGREIVLGPYLGDLTGDATIAAFEFGIERLLSLYDGKPSYWVHDLHPDYASTLYAERAQRASSVDTAGHTPSRTEKPIGVQHHEAHAWSAILEHRLSGPLLAVVWDGTGLGTDGTSWGGEFFLIQGISLQRVGHLNYFPLLGGDLASKEPSRCALGLLYSVYGMSCFTPEHPAYTFIVRNFSAYELGAYKSLLNNARYLTYSSSVGRCFDAVAALLGVCLYNTYEAQAAIALEALLEQAPKKNGSIEPNAEDYAFKLIADNLEQPVRIDCREVLDGILSDLQHGVVASVIALKFHRSLVAMMLSFAQQIRKRFECKTVVLSGGCFQNAWLLDNARMHLQAAGFEVHWPQATALNDDSIALGQLMAAHRRLSAKGDSGTSAKERNRHVSGHTGTFDFD